MRTAYTILLGIFCVYGLAGLSSFASAQSLDPVLLEAPKPLGDIRLVRREPDIETFEPVAKRTPSDLEAIPIHWRGFKLNPVLISSQLIDTNIFATANDEETDTITTLNPALYVSKEFGRHEANAAIEGEFRKFWSNTDEDVFNFSTKLAGTLEARREIQIPFELTYTSGHEKRTQNFSNNFSKKPIAFNSFGSALGVAYNPNRLNLSLIGRYGGIAFDNGTTRTGQAVIREDGDRTYQDVEFTAAYELLPNHRPFVSVSYGQIDYKNKTFTGTGFNGINRDSTSTEILAGWQLSYKGLVEGYLGVGYGTRSYDSAQIDDIDSFKISSNIDWNITKKATFNLGLKKVIGEDNQVAQGLILTQGRLGLDYEFLHNLFYNAFIDYSFADFQGIQREDDIFSAGTGLRYVINPRFSVSGDYDYKTRDSSALGQDYDRHQFMVRLHTRF